MTDYPYCTSRKNTSDLTELSSINKVFLVKVSSCSNTGLIRAVNKAKFTFAIFVYLENAFSKEVEGKYGITKNESAATNPLKRRMDNNDEEFCAKKKRCVK